MEPLYQPEGVEQRWQRTWEEEGLYRAGAGARRAKATAYAVPPPNVTGELHMGHALNCSIQDSLIRWHRMRGFDTLWQPGYDHAGISTQNVGREAADRRGHVAPGARPRGLPRAHVGTGSTRHGRTIMSQFRRLGASLDYRRERFTMDDGYVARRDDATSCISGSAAGSTGRTGSSTGARTTRPRSPTSRSSTSRWTTRLRTRATRSPTARAHDHDRHRTAGDDPRRRRRRGAPGRRALPATRSARRSSSRRRAPWP